MKDKTAIRRSERRKEFFFTVTMLNSSGNKSYQFAFLVKTYFYWLCVQEFIF
jgi:hypothetical protein